MAKKYRSEAYAAIHETMEALHEVGAIDKQTMREFDETGLTPALPKPPEQAAVDRVFKFPFKGIPAVDAALEARLETAAPRPREDRYYPVMIEPPDA